MLRGSGFIGVLMLLALPCRAQDALPEIRPFDIPTLEKLGHDMYLQDQVAWHASDALLARHPQAQMLKEKVHGWIVEDRPAGRLVRFIRESDAGPEAAYDVQYGQGVDYAHDTPSITEP